MRRRSAFTDAGPRAILGFLLLGGTLVIAVLVVVTLLTSVGDLRFQAAATDEPAERGTAQRARDRAAGVTFRREGATVLIQAKRKSPALDDLRGARFTVQCGFLSHSGATLAQGEGRWPRRARRVTVRLDSVPGDAAQFCEIALGTEGPEIARAVFPVSRDDEPAT